MWDNAVRMGNGGGKVMLPTPPLPKQSRSHCSGVRRRPEAREAMTAKIGDLQHTYQTVGTQSGQLGLHSIVVERSTWIFVLH